MTLWGFEWSNPLLGHINVINSPDFTNVFLTFRLSKLYKWLAARPNAFGRFNHPGEYDDFWLEFLHLFLHHNARSQMVGIETWNGNSSFDRYYYAGGYSSDLSYWDEGNRKGWLLGPLGAEDNHRGNWGTVNEFRTAILAEELTREAIIDGYRNRRFYATEDKDLKLDFRVQGYPMGSRLSGVDHRTFEVAACDGSNDTFGEVRFYRNGVLMQTRIVDGNCIAVSFNDSFVAAAYYYVIVQQNDDNDGNGRNDEAISSPIWIQ